MEPVSMFISQRFVSGKIPGGEFTDIVPDIGHEHTGGAGVVTLRQWRIDPQTVKRPRSQKR